MGFIVAVRNANLNNLIKAKNICVLYTISTISIGVITFFYSIWTTVESYPYRQINVGIFDIIGTEHILVMVCVLSGGLLYCISLNKLLLIPVENNFSKFVSHGLVFFKNKNKGIIKSDSGNSYSVAEELLKWSELKEKGIISEEEFTVMKKNIIERQND